jgi:DNA-directed RNA polymerase beta subunit
MNYTLNNNDRLQLDKMLKANDVEDKTELIRTTRHSSKIRENVQLLELLKKENNIMYKENFQDFDYLASQKCIFLFNNYTDIYNKVLKDEINLNILDKFLNALEEIEENKIDQHEASVKVGTYLKELYIDSALKKTEKNDAKEKQDIEQINIENISWNEFKKII